LEAGMAEITNILWDVGGVLLTNGWDHIERAAVLDQFALDGVAFEQRHEAVTDPWEKGWITGDQYLQQTVFYEPRPFTPDAFLQQMKERSVLLPNTAMRILQGLAASEQVGLVMLNNEARELNDYRIEHFGLERYFDAFLSSCYIGLRKPDAKMFELALDVLQRNPAELALIDDRQQNCDAAQALGIHAIRYQDEAQCLEALDQLVLHTSVNI
jgi:putative hydrolase of the HAD superfamily